MGKNQQKQNDHRQLSLVAPQGDASPELVMNSVEIPPPLMVQPDLIRLPQQILCVKVPPASGKTAPKLNPDFFLWPTTNASIGDGHIAKDHWPEKGALKHVGYRVGILGKSKPQRLAILRTFFELDAIPILDSPTYVAEWGSQRSSARLKKMAYSIATFCRFAKGRRRAWMGPAITHWEADLAWLKATFYNGRFDIKFC